MKAGGRTAALAVTLAMLVGCAGPRVSGGRSEIGEIHLFGVPVALNLDSRPGPDGIGVRVFMTPAGRARGTEMREGRLDVLMFDGVVTAADFTRTPPLKVWSFNARQLAPVVGSSALGIGYQLALNWEQNRPHVTSVTVVARYHPPSGPDLFSTPNSISVGTR